MDGIGESMRSHLLDGLRSRDSSLPFANGAAHVGRGSQAMRTAVMTSATPRNCAIRVGCQSTRPFQILPVVVRHVGGPNEIAQAVGGGPSGAVSSSPAVCVTTPSSARPRRWPGVDGLDGRDLDLGDRPLTGVTTTSCQRRVLEITESVAACRRGRPSQIAPVPRAPSTGPQRVLCGHRRQSDRRTSLWDRMSRTFVGAD
jgi:hypothetical protein